MFVIIGAGGFLGSEMIHSVINHTSDCVLAVARNGNVYEKENSRVEVVEGDIENEDFISQLIRKINSYDNVTLLWTVACHNIDFVAENPDSAYKLNVEIPRKVLGELKNVKRLFFTSSDTVYGEGGKHLFSENDRLQPISVYGKQKAEAEKVFLQYGGVILRLPLMFSQSRAVSKKHFCDVVCENLLSGRQTTLTTGFLRSALSYSDVADIITQLSYEEALPSVINVAGDDSLSKYQLGIMLAEKLGADKNLLICADKWGEFREGAERAQSTLLDNTLLKNILGREEIKMKL